MVVIRTITASVSLSKNQVRNDVGVVESKIQRSVKLLDHLKQSLEKEAIVEQVQTVRIAFNPIEEWIDFSNGKDDVLLQVETLSKLVKDIDFVNLGPMKDPENFDMIGDILSKGKNLNLSGDLGNKLNFDNATKLAKVSKEVAKLEPNATGSFRFCMTSKIKSGTPFFPAAFFDFDDQVVHFSIGMETSDLLARAADTCLKDDGKTSFELFESNLTDEYAKVLDPLNKACQTLAKEHSSCHYDGIDASMNPSLAGEGIGTSLKRILTGIQGDQVPNSNFGVSGSLALSFSITSSIKKAGEQTNTQLCGYSGLMLPQMEDKGLAKAADEGSFSVRDLLLSSAVCGVGVDTVPLEGETSVEKLGMLMLDVHALSLRWDKPLSCRVLIVEGKKAGERVDFENPYLCASTVLGLP